MLTDLGDPLVDEVAERAGADHTVAEEEDVSVLVAQRPETLQLVLHEAETEGLQVRGHLAMKNPMKRPNPEPRLWLTVGCWRLMADEQ